MKKHNFISDIHNACQICGKGKRVELHDKEPKTQGKIEIEAIKFLGKIFPTLDLSSATYRYRKQDLIDLIQEQQQALLQRVIELIGENETHTSGSNDMDDEKVTRNDFRQFLKTKISQMGEEI